MTTTSTRQTPGKTRLSVLQGVLPIDAAQVPREVIAGITLAALAIPEVMGYTKISGTPVVTGLYTMLVPTVLFALFGSSRHLVVGADSATAAILASGLMGAASAGSAEYAALASVLALMAAGFLLLARWVGLGFLADFLSRTVLVGFLTGVGLQVALGQVAGMLGLEGGGHGTLQQIWNDLLQLGEINLHALTIAGSALLTIFVSKRVSRKIPGALIAVVAAMIGGWALGLEAHVPVVGEVPGGLPQFGLPRVFWSWDLVGRLMPTAFAMFVVILAQSAATSRAYAARYDERFNENTDLLGLALANIGAGLSGAFVVNGSPTKTQMVDSAGGRSQLSLLVTAAIVLLVLLFLTRPLAYLPEAVLSAVVFRIGIDLIDVKGMRRIFAQRPSEFWVALITTAAVVLFGVEAGVLLAIVLSLIEHTRHGYHPKNVLLVPDRTGAWQAKPLATHAQAAPGLLLYRFTHSMYYANSQQLSEEVLDLAARGEPPVRWFCIDASAVGDVDFTAAETLKSLRGALKEKGVHLVVAQVQDDVKEESRAGLGRSFGEKAFFATLGDVLEAYRRRAGGEPEIGPAADR